MTVEDLIGKKIADNVSKIENLVATIKVIDKEISETNDPNVAAYNFTNMFRYEMMMELYTQANNDLLEILSAYRKIKGGE